MKAHHRKINTKRVVLHTTKSSPRRSVHGSKYSTDQEMDSIAEEQSNT